MKRKINAAKIQDTIAFLCKEANFSLRSDVLALLKQAYGRETGVSKDALKAVVENARIAHLKQKALCQDTGLPTVFVKIGQDVEIVGDFNKAVVCGIEKGYSKNCLRNSIVADPICRCTPGFVPPVVHVEIVPGSKLHLAVLPKGFGCENKSSLIMMHPTAAVEEIINAVVEVIKRAGPDACPPYIAGIGIGGTSDYALLLAKKALLEPVKIPKISKDKNSLMYLKSQIYKKANQMGIGPMGLGGKTTLLGVNILTFPTHIAGLPVGVSLSCHSLRSAKAVI